MRTSMANAILHYVPGRFQRVASTHGGEWAGPCPWCKGTDRFRIWPNRDPYAIVYWCRQCGKHGDVIQFLREKEGLSFREACEKAGLSGNGKGAMDPEYLLRPRTHVSMDEKQLRLVAAIEVVKPVMQAALRDPLPSAYLSFRGIPQELAAREGCLYLPMPRDAEAREKLGPELLPWCGRLIVPTRSPQGHGYVGRCLRGWKLGMTEADHKTLLEKHKIPRYMTTGGGWAWQEHAGTQTGVVILVEGVFDRLALLAAGLPAEEVIAVGSDSGNPDWLPLSVKSVVAAFDADTAGPGRKATAQFLTKLKLGGVHVIACLPPDDDMGKDASERWRRTGDEGIDYIIATWSAEVSRLAEARAQLAMAAHPAEPTDAVTTAHEVTIDQTLLPASPLETLTEEPEAAVASPIVEVVAGAPEPVVEPSFLDGYSQTAQQVLTLAHSFPTAERMVLDLETTGLGPRTSKVITLAIGTPGQVMIIDLRGYYTSDPGQQEAWKDALQQLLHRDGLWMGHNLKFDWSFLAQQFGVRLKRVYDTMLVEKLLHAGGHVSASLQASAERYGVTVTKEQRSWFIDLDRRAEEWMAPLPEVQLAYIRQDIEVPYQIYERQQEAIAQQDLARVVSLEHQALPAIAAMEVHGVCVDVERWRGILAARRAQRVALEAQIKQVLGEALARTQPAQATLFGEPVLPSVQLTSSDQLREALHALGVHMTSASKEALQEVEQQHTVIPLLLEWKALEKFETAFGENLLNYVTTGGRIHATFDQLGAASGRVICREPNLQQIPRPTDKDDPYDLRRCFVAPEGYRLLIADLSNIELRILAEVSADSTMLRFFADGKDLHSETARLMFKLPADVDPKVHLVNGRKARDIAKTINFGLAYGMGAQGLANRVGVGLETAKVLMQSYFATYRAVSKYLARSGKEGMTRGYAMSLSGRRRFFSQEELRARRGEAERSAKNHPIQGTNADILKRALALLYEQLPAGVYVVLTVHDEIVLECPEELVEKAKQGLKDAMLAACREYLKAVHVPEPEVLVEGYWAKG
jgi:DNA polymerase I